MRKEYFSSNGLWLIITTMLVYVVTIYFMLDESVNTFKEYMPFIAILLLNTAMLVLYGRELFSKEPLLILEEGKMTIRGMFKTHIIKYEDIQKVQKTFNGSKNKKQINRIGIKLYHSDKSVYIIVQSIEYDSEKLYKDIIAMVYKNTNKKG